MSLRRALCRLAPGLVAALVLAAPARGQIRSLPAPGAHTSFGAAVALGGDGDEATRALVGASGEDTCGDNSGAVYVFEREGGEAWTRSARLVPSDCEAGAFFGRSLALSGDRVLVGASKEYFADERPNVAYIFEKNTETGAWEEKERLTVDPRRAEGTFAASVALDSARALVTARASLPASAPAREDASPPVAQRTAGAAYVFERDAHTDRWHRTARLRPSQPDARRAFGGSAALDGDCLAVTASPYFAEGNGVVYVFEKRNSEAPAPWHEAARLEGFDGFSIPIALQEHRLLVGESRAGRRQGGAAMLFERRATGEWEEQARLQPRTPYREGAFGSAVALGGDRALVTGYDEQLGLGFNIDRVVYVFARQPAAAGRARWRQQQLLDVGAVSFGTDIDVYGSNALVGHATEDGAGAAYVIGLQ